MGRGAFLDEFTVVPPDVDDAQIDSLVTRHFQIDPAYAPDIIRAYLRRVLAEGRAADAWDALMALERDLDQLAPGPALERAWTRPNHSPLGQLSLAALLN